MFEDGIELIVLVSLMIDVVFTVALLYLNIRYKHVNDILKIGNSTLDKKIAILETGNSFLKETVDDLKSANEDLLRKNVKLSEENRVIRDSLAQTQKKLTSFSKIISDMKNS